MTTSRTARMLAGPALWVLGQAALVATGIFVYFRVRGLTEGSEDVAVRHARDIAELEGDLGIHIEPSVQSPV